MSIMLSKISRCVKEQKYVTQIKIKKKKQSIETEPRMTQMLESADNDFKEKSGHN